VFYVFTTHVLSGKKIVSARGRCHSVAGSRSRADWRAASNQTVSMVYRATNVAGPLTQRPASLSGKALRYLTPLTGKNSLKLRWDPDSFPAGRARVGPFIRQAVPLLPGRFLFAEVRRRHEVAAGARRGEPCHSIHLAADRRACPLGLAPAHRRVTEALVLGSRSWGEVRIP
jgi:hypothetical protein